jgi:PAS domain S-box-containing protein
MTRWAAFRADGRLARWAAVVPAVVGLAILAGWWLGSPFLRSGLGRGGAINPPTGVMFLVAAVSIWVSSVQRAGRALRRLGAACAALILLIAALKLLAPLFGWSPALDQLPFRASLAALGSKAPRPMSGGSAILYLMIGAALLLVRARREAWRLLARSVGLFLGLIGVLSLITYTYRLATVTNGSASSSGFNMILAVLALAIGITASGLPAPGASSEEADPHSLRGRVNLGFAVAVTILILTSGVSIWSTIRSRSADRLQEESSARKAQLATLLSSLQDIENGQRGFLLSGYPEFLHSSQTALDSLPSVVRRTTDLVGRSAPQAARLDSLQRLVRQAVALFTETRRFQQTRRSGEALAIERSGRSAAIMEGIRRQLSTMAAEEDSLNARLGARVLHDDRISLSTNVFAALLAVFFLILAGLAINQDLRKRGRMEAALRQSELILSSVGEGVHGIDLEGRIIFENPAAARMLGWDAEDLIGKPAHATIHHHHADGTEYPQGECPIYATLRDGQPRQVKDEAFWRRSGTSFPVDYTTAPLRDGAGRLYGSTVIFHDITERKQLEEERDRFFAISLDMLCIANADGYFKRISPAFTDTLGWTVQEMLDRPFLDFVHPDDQAATLREVERQTVAGDPVLHFENRYRHKNGSWRVLSWRSVPQPGGLMFATARDVTDAQQAATALRSAKEAAEAANRAKSDFLAKMSHELRTPLNSIIGFSEILEDEGVGPLSEKQHRYVANVLLSGRNLLHLINDILDLSKVEAGRMELAPSLFDIRTALEQVRGIVATLADKKGLSIQLDVAPDLPVLSADPAKFKQIMYNLLGNAIKFTPAGGRVEVTAGLARSSGNGAGGELLEVAVADTGIGISAEDLTRIFNEFEQVTSHPQYEEQGTGLGLALTRKLVELHGGRVWVESVVGQGSVFRFTLPYPRARAEVVEAAILPGKVPDEGQTGPLVLVIDNDPSARHLIMHYLAEGGYRTESAVNGEEAIRLAHTLRPAAITLDMLLPDRDGLLILAQLKSNPDTSGIPVVVVSVTDRRELGFSLGAADWLVKPIQRSALLAALQRTIRAPSSASRPSILVVDDEPATVEYLSELLQQNGFAVLPAAGGRAGIDLARSRHPDLILLDLMMPEVNGFDVVRALRGDSGTSDIPILILTAMDLTRADAERLGSSVQAIVAKGGPETLLTELARICPVARSAREAVREAAR